MKLFCIAVLSILFLPPLSAQQGGDQKVSPCMPGMPMPGCPDSSAQQSSDGQLAEGSHEEAAGMQMGKTGLMGMAGMQPQTFLQAIVQQASSGTSAEPNSTPAPMFMTQKVVGC